MNSPDTESSLARFGYHVLGDGPIDYSRPSVEPRSFDIFDHLSKLVTPRTVVEIGSWEGASAIAWANAVRPFDGRVVCVDTWLGSIEHHADTVGIEEWRRDRLFIEDGYPTLYRTFTSNIRRHMVEDIVIPVTIDAHQAFTMMNYVGMQPDIVYIDGSHDRDAAYLDIDHAMGLGGRVVCGDDYFGEVRVAVDQYAARHGVQVVTKQDQWVLLDRGMSIAGGALVGWGWFRSV
jgi:hypothetical protein